MNLSGYTSITPAELAQLEKALPVMSVKEKMELLDDLEERERRAGIVAARDSLLGFAHALYPGFKEGPHHRKMAKVFAEVMSGQKKRVIVNIAPRFGKLLADDTPVLTPVGWKTHGELRVGDYVFHPSGRPVMVLGVSAPAPADVRVEFFDGSVFWCHERHEWSLWNMSRACWETLEAQHFLTPRRGRWGVTGGTQKQVLSDGRALHHLPLVEPLRFPPAQQALHPYVLGAWLGDGSAGKACVSHAASDQAYVDKIVACGYEVSAVCTHKDTGVLTTYFSGPRPGVAGLMTKQLQELGVYFDKHIPNNYLHASIEQRLELLAGLIDTDGHVDKSCRCTFTSVNRRLVDGVIELVRSFGWRATDVAVQPRMSSSGIQGKQTYWCVAFQPTLEIPTALPRKKIDRLAPRRRIGLKSVERDPRGKIGRCITVDSEDGMYVVGEQLTPTHNSELSSYLFPAYFLGKYPEKKVMMGTHTVSLSEHFGRRVRNLLQSAEYAAVFPKTIVSEDQQAAGNWSTTVGGQYYAVGVGGSIAGRGADLLFIDDPVSEQAVTSNSTLAFETAWNWFQTGPLQRLMPGGAIIVVMTRWSLIDLTGKLIDYQIKNPDSDRWEIVELPAILGEGENEKSLWPEQWPLAELQAKRAGMDPRYWQAQYMQNPTSNIAAMIPRTAWREWLPEKPPKCDFLLQSWDTAYETHNTADYSACTTWGVWYNEAENNAANIILLDAFKGRMGFPELKATAIKHYREWQPDSVIIEKKAAGTPLVQEMRSTGLPIMEFTPSRGNDKISRLNAIADIFASGRVWAPGTRWAREVIEEVACFPSGVHDDYVDCTSMALMRFRQGGYIPLDKDEKEDEWVYRARRRAAYY